MDNPLTVHDINVLTVVADESYRDFVSALQKDISDSLTDRPKVADEKYFTGKILQTENGNVEITPVLAKQIYKYLIEKRLHRRRRRYRTKAITKQNKLSN
jgi:type III restriction enzyme